MKIMRLAEVIECTGLARSTIYKYIAEGTFPKQLSLGARNSGWLKSEVEDWILERVAQRDREMEV